MLPAISEKQQMHQTFWLVSDAGGEQMSLKISSDGLFKTVANIAYLMRVVKRFDNAAVLFIIFTMLFIPVVETETTKHHHFIGVG